MEPQSQPTPTPEVPSTPPAPQATPSIQPEPAVAPVTAPTTEVKKYSKRPMWQWVVIYLVVAAIAYAAIYFLLFNETGSDSGNSLY